MNSSWLAVSKAITVFLTRFSRSAKVSATNWNRKEKEMSEEMTPVAASLTPISFSSFARNASAAKIEMKYSKVHWAAYAPRDRR